MGTVRKIGEPSASRAVRIGLRNWTADGINDLFVDADGDGVCDDDALYARDPYMMVLGYEDGDSDGMNDHFRDAEGDGINDLTGHGYVSGYGHGDGGGMMQESRPVRK